MVSDKRLVCEESHDEEDEEAQSDSTATLSPTTPYASEILQKWVQIWHTLDVEDVDIYEIILLAVNCHLPDWRGEAVHWVACGMGGFAEWVDGVMGGRWDGWMV